MSASNESTEMDENGNTRPTSGLTALVTAMNDNMALLMDLQRQSSADLAQVLTKPRRRTLERGPDGRAISTIEMEG